MASDRVSPSNLSRFSNPISLGEGIELDFAAYELRRGGRLLKLERIPTELLILLVEQRGTLVTRDQIVERVWGKGVFLDTDASINAAIRKIRQALKDDPEHPRFVQTVTGRGYRFIGTVEEPVPVPVEAVITPALVSEGFVGRKIAHYRIIKLIGGGGMGVVYQAEDLKLGRRVALKFLPAEVATDPKAFQRLQAEARAASALDHPNICAIYELGEHEGQPFIAMQLLEGQTLREWIAARAGLNTPLPMGEVLDLAIQISSGLEAAHQKGMVHRDIKPANIFVTNRGEAKILDFGVAKFVDVAETQGESSANESHSHPSQTRTGVSMGTPSYLSPEQVRGDKVDARADLFALGIVLYEMATGRQPFPGNTVQDIRDAVLNKAATPIRWINPALCPELESIIHRALEKDPNDRYQSASELHADAERLRSKWLVTTLRDQAAPHRKRMWFAGAVACALLLTTGIWVTVRPKAKSVHAADVSAPAKSRPAVAVVAFKNLSGRPDLAWMSIALAEMMNTDLANGQHVRVIPSESVAQMSSDLALPASDSYAGPTLQKIHNRLGADMVVLGSFLVTGNAADSKIRIDLHLQDTHTGEMVAAVSAQGTTGDLADLASRSGATLRKTMGLPATKENDTQLLRASLPSNPEAARFYSEGLAHLRQYDPLAARQSLEQAVLSDPAHALSHSALAESLAALGYDLQARTEAKKALDLANGLAREDRLLIEARFRELTHDYTAAVEIYRTLHNFFPDDLEYALRLASAQTKAGHGKDALQTVAQMRALPGPDGSDAQIDLAEAAAAQSLGDLKLCMKAAQAAVVRAEVQGNRQVTAAALIKESWPQIRMGETDRALEIMARAQVLITNIGDARTAARNTHGIALVHAQRGDFEPARLSFEQALAQFRRLGAMSDVASVSHNYGVLLYEHGNMVASRKLLEDALRIQRGFNDDRGVASDLDDLSNVLISTGELSKALQMKEEALALFRASGDRKGEAITLGAMARAHFLQGNLEAAQQELQQSLAIKRELGETVSQAYALEGLAFVRLAQDRLSEAHDYAQQGLALRQQANTALHIAESQAQLAEITLQQGNAAEAESLANSAARVLEANNSLATAAYAYTILARAQNLQGKIVEEQRASSQAAILSRQSGDLAAHFEAELQRAIVSADAGKTAEAAKALTSVRQQAARSGYASMEIEARIRLARFENKPQTRQDLLRQLQIEAKQKGYLLLAREASSR